MKKNKLRRRSVRTLSAILTVMLIFSVVPAIPIFAGASVKTLKLNVPEELGLTYIYDGSSGFDAFLYDDGTKKTGVVVSELTTAETDIKFGTGECKIKKESESGAIVITAASGGATLPNIQLGVAITKEADKLTATVSSEGASRGISASTSLELDGTFATGTYIGNIQMPFAARLNSGWSGIKEESITVDLSVPAQTYTLTYNKNSVNYDVKNKEGTQVVLSPSEITADSDYEFTVVLKETSKNNKLVPVVYAHIAGATDSPILLEEQGKKTGASTGEYAYKIEQAKITGDIELEITLLSALTVTLPQGEGYTATGDTTVPYGSGSYEFTVTPDEGWDVKASYSLGGEVTQFEKNSDDEPKDSTYREEGGKFTYTIKPQNGITTNITIYIVATKKTFSITTAEGVSLESEAFTTSFVNQTAIPYNGQYSFTVTANTGYANPKVTISDAISPSSIIDGAAGLDKKIALFGAKPIREAGTLTKASVTTSGDYYTISAIKGNIQVKIEETEKTSYAINKFSGTGYELSVKKKDDDQTDQTLANYGDELTITLKLLDGYTNSNPVLKIDGVQVQQASSDEAQYTYKYTMPAKAITITVEGVTKNRYTVTLPESTEKYTVNKTTQEVEHGLSFEFTVKLNPGWEVTGITEKNYKALFTDFDNNAAGTVSADETKTTFTVTVGEGGVTKPLTFTIDENKVTKKTFNVSVDSYNETDEQGTNTYVVNWAGDPHDNLAYGSSVSFSVSPKTGYVIGEVSYTMGENRVTKVLGNGPGSYTVENITGDVKITVTCTAIKVSVTYSYPDLAIFGKKISKNAETKEYTVGTSNQIKTDSGFTLTLGEPQEDSIKGVQFNGWTYNGSITTSINLGTLTVSADNTIYVTVIADWELVVKDSANENEGGGGAFYVESEKPAEGQHLEAPDEDGYYRVQVDGSLQSDLLEGFLSQLGLSGEGITFLKAGLVYTNNELTDEKLESLRDQLKNTTESQLLDDSTYVFVNDVTGQNFGIGDTFSQRVNFGKNKPDGITRYAAIYFVIEVNGQRYVFFGAIQNLTEGQQ